MVATEALDTGIKASDYMIINGCTTVMIKRERRKSNLAIPRHLVKRVRENPVKRADLLLSRMFHLPLERVVTDPFPPPPPPPFTTLVTVLGRTFLEDVF